mmetsp:Transcript_17323/g.60923  ORF Transcript_17323/g.60923 Transcript_17323/m.60923 type:complete len:1168 (-) Transcript_17323:78-3581(-)
MALELDGRFEVVDTDAGSVIVVREGAGAGAAQGAEGAKSGGGAAAAKKGGKKGKGGGDGGKKAKGGKQGGGDGGAGAGAGGATGGASGGAGGPAAAPSPPVPKSTARRDRLLEMQQEMQAKWEEEKLFEGTPEPGRKKFMGTFPYPYMNGRLHLGHAFTVTKAEFATSYHRARGENALFPFSFHCTGMPIQAAANKIKREMEMFGNPPDFSLAVKKVEKEEETAVKMPGKFGSKRSKAAAKTGGAVYQWNIMKSMGIDEAEIPSFADAEYWLRYFPPYAKTDLTAFGCNVDWRRSFITTETNPYYDSFIRWQFRTLKRKDKVAFGKRPTVYSVLDGQACADHDRATGEGVGPQEYTLIKLRVVEPRPECLAGIAGNIFLVAATLRPETMYGQTNCFVLPEGEYGAFQMKDDEVYVCSERAARNLSYQDATPEEGKVECLATMTGQDLMGCPLSAPNATYDVVYTLPLLTISMGKGTGVVTSVPSDAPDDFAALRDLQQKEGLRAKFGVKDEWVVPFKVVPIIEIPGYGTTSAVKVVEDKKIKSQNDTAKLKEAKEEVYLKGFYEGVLLVGSQAGQKVCDAKPKVREEMIAEGKARPYHEPEKTVMSRSGDECVVAYLDQWFIKYGEEEWKDVVERHVHSDRFTTYSDRSLAQFESVLGWLREWACSRSFGLGTKLPWDEQFVIESLSDSTIYMSYYTIAHLIQGGVVDGSVAGPAGIAPGDFTDADWDYIFLQRPHSAENGVSEDKLAPMRAEFEYWYPMDLRVSGKDLINNHLTMSLYNHAAIWDGNPDRMPQSFYTNGHVLVDAVKMSKSLGNFLMLHEAISEYSADAVRLACADAGDTMDDANFERATANNAILLLTKEEEWIKTMLVEEAAALRSDDGGTVGRFFDNVLTSRINEAIVAAAAKYDEMLFRDGLQIAFYGLRNARDSYRDACEKAGIALNGDLVRRFIEVQCALMAPITPHYCDYVWRTYLGKSGSARSGSWPEAGPVDTLAMQQWEFVERQVRSVRLVLSRRAGKGQPPASRVFFFTTKENPAWRQAAIDFLESKYDDATNALAPTALKEARGVLGKVLKGAGKKVTNAAMQFVAQIARDELPKRGRAAFDLSTPYDEAATLTDNAAYIAAALEVPEVKTVDVADVASLGDIPAAASKAAENAMPGEPSFGVM